jgi:hypothetical protein
MTKAIFKPPRIGPLKDTRDCSRELGRIYRLYRSRDIDEIEAKCCTYILKTLSSIIRDNDFETRLEALEAQLCR